ncbi:COG4648 family protein [Hirschia baltica]|uniref:Intracellular septation protein A n=1 Tax=Hirschia baltica (strain ATCC 49814 / DSM 5838 / IFAM 1418) TaxID=582402 RepID=C6XIQ9_HIRBI|nr:hypothetical protein [Hirschia baltica]ACT59004.1 conserved hypothetical protein [Hirschia baltica ATCC 49814]
MKRFASVIIAGLMIIYPLIAVVLLKHFSPIWLILALVFALTFRLWLGGKSAPLSMIVASIAAIIGISVTAVYDQELSIRLYPVFMGGAILVAFLVSLIRPPSMIERFARLAEPDLPPHAVRYTYKVTILWCVFIALNLVVALWTVLYASTEVWAIYNGAIAYALMGILFLSELVYRKFIRKAE